MKKTFQKHHHLAEPYPANEFKDFISENININIKNSLFAEEMKNFLTYYHDFFVGKEGISVRDMLHIYMRTINVNILYVHRDDNYNRPSEINDYREEYKKMNKNVFDNIKKTYFYNLENGIVDEDIQKRFFYISLVDVIEIYICRKINEIEGKENISLYRSNFFTFLRKNIHRIDSKTHMRLWYGI